MHMHRVSRVLTLLPRPFGSSHFVFTPDADAKASEVATPLRLDSAANEQPSGRQPGMFKVELR